MKKEIIAGITKDGELYTLNIETERPDRGDFSMTGETNIPIKLEDAKERVREQLEDGEEWKMAVEADRTTQSKDDWIEYVLATDGELAGFDNSLFPVEVEVEGERWIFEASACGQHEESNLAHYFIDEYLFKCLMKTWKLYHLKELPSDKSHSSHAVIAEAMKIEQDQEELAIKAVEIIKQDNEDADEQGRDFLTGKEMGI